MVLPFYVETTHLDAHFKITLAEICKYFTFGSTPIVGHANTRAPALHQGDLSECGPLLAVLKNS
jgi:hypothetical protein